MDPAQVWSSVLDALASALDAQETALGDSIEAAAPPFRPPAVMPPLPPSLIARVQELGRRNDALLARARQRSDELPAPVPATQRRAAFAAPRRAVFDQRG